MDYHFQSDGAGDGGYGVDRLSIKRGGGMLAVFGLPFFVMGLLFASSPFWGFFSSSSGNAPPPLVACLVGLLFATIGAVFIFGRMGVVLDRSQGTATAWWGLLVPFKAKQRPLSDFDAVAITKEIRRSDKSTYTVYPVRLTGTTDPLNIEESRDADRARDRAEEVAKFLNLGVEDSSSGETVRREAGTLDESVRDRLLRTGEEIELPEQPAGCKSTYRSDGDTLVIDIPPPGFRLQQILIMVMGLVFPGFVCVGFLPVMLTAKTKPPAFVVGFVVLFFVLLPLLLTWIPAIKMARTRDRVATSSRSLEVQRKGLLFGKTTTIPMDELEELVIAGAADGARPGGRAFAAGPVVKARSDRCSIEFGRGLPPAEIDWLLRVVQYMAVTEAG